MTDYITAAALFCLGCFGVYLIHLMKQPVPPERHEYEDDTPAIILRKPQEGEK